MEMRRELMTGRFVDVRTGGKNFRAWNERWSHQQYSAGPCSPYTDNWINFIWFLMIWHRPVSSQSSRPGLKLYGDVVIETSLGAQTCTSSVWWFKSFHFEMKSFSHTNTLIEKLYDFRWEHVYPLKCPQNLWVGVLFSQFFVKSAVQ